MVLFNIFSGGIQAGSVPGGDFFTSPQISCAKRELPSSGKGFQDLSRDVLFKLPEIVFKISNKFQCPFPTERLKAISISNQINNADDKIIDALLNTLNNDENVNVRLMAVEALYNYADNPKVRIGLIRSIEKQESPIVQVALADVMVMLQEKRSVSELKKLLEKNNIDKNVEAKLKSSIELLI